LGGNTIFVTINKTIKDFRMADFTIEEVYKAFKIQDEKLPFRSWIRRKYKKKKKTKETNKKREQKKDGHIDIYA